MRAEGGRGVDKDTTGSNWLFKSHRGAYLQGVECQRRIINVLQDVQVSCVLGALNAETIVDESNAWRFLDF
jgi:hypothetical protein